MVGKGRGGRSRPESGGLGAKCMRGEGAPTYAGVGERRGRRARGGVVQSRAALPAQAEQLGGRDDLALVGGQRGADGGQRRLLRGDRDRARRGEARTYVLLPRKLQFESSFLNRGRKQARLMVMGQMCRPIFLKLNPYLAVTGFTRTHG